MWETPCGVRTLVDAEASLIRQLALALGEDLYSGTVEPSELGYTCLASLTRNQALALLQEVAEALLSEEIPAPPQTSVNEAMIAALFDTLRIYLEAELQEDPDLGHEMRDRVVAVLDQAGEIDEETFEGEPSDDVWFTRIAVLTDFILWDEDFAMDHMILDMEPEQAQVFRAVMGIADDYYTGVPPDPPDEALDGIRQQLVALCAE